MRCPASLIMLHKFWPVHKREHEASATMKPLVISPTSMIMSVWFMAMTTAIREKSLSCLVTECSTSFELSTKQALNCTETDFDLCTNRLWTTHKHALNYTQNRLWTVQKQALNYKQTGFELYTKQNLNYTQNKLWAVQKTSFELYTKQAFN